MALVQKHTLLTSTKPKEVELYFDEPSHKYTDSCGNAYTSMTTVGGKYHNHFDTEAVAAACVRIGKNPFHPKYLKYKGMTKAEILLSWDKTRDDACENGTFKHNYLEQAVKKSNRFLSVKGIYTGKRLCTVADILKDHSFGQIDIDVFISTGINVKYPKIYATILAFVQAGWRIYAEIGVYNVEFLVSGLIDLLLVKGNDCVIIDWKTNRANIRFESGYYEKDMEGNLTDKYILTNKLMKAPLSHLADSVGNHYTIQISGYATMLECFGLNYKGGLLYQIRDVPNPVDGLEQVDEIVLPVFRNECIAMFKHHYSTLTLNQQTKLFL